MNQRKPRKKNNSYKNTPWLNAATLIRDNFKFNIL